MLVFCICLVIFIVIAVAASAAAKEDDNLETDSESYSRDYEPSYNNAHSCSDTISSDDLRIDSETEISLPAVSDDKRTLLRSVVRPWKPIHDSQTGVVVGVVGGSYRSKAAREVYATLKIGDSVTLKIDPDNEYDDTAVKVYAKRCHIGYVPQEYSSVIYSYLILEKFDSEYVVEPSESGNFNDLKIVLFLK